MEFPLRQSLQNDHAKLPGLHPENKTKMTDTPTAERILKAFADVSLTIIKQAAGEGILRRLTPLSGCRRPSCNVWGWVLLSIGSLKFRVLEIDWANGELISIGFFIFPVPEGPMTQG